MKKRLLSFVLVVLVLVSAACATAATPAPTATLAPSATPAPTHTPIPPTETPVPPTATLVPEPVLEIAGVDASKSLTMDEILNLPVSEGQAGIKSSTGKITPPTGFKGVALKDLAEVLGGFDDTMGISLVAKDGYAITYSYDQVMNGTFISYDPGTGDELKSPVPLTAILAYEIDGKPLNEEMDGKLRLVIISEKNSQVTDGHWSVKWVTKVEFKSLGEAWTLHLHGAISELMDRATFESGSSPNCHAVTWTDDKAQDWVGIPLWLLVGRVDDEIKHEGPAFNDALAEAGYTVDVIATDGYTVTFDSARLKRNDNIIVANSVNGNPLPDKYYPLRLVGSDLQKNEMVGAIEKIVVNVEPLPTPETTTEPATTTASTEADLVINGLVTTETSLSEADLRAMEVVEITAEHPKKGPQTYEGVLLSALLELAGLKPEAKKLVLTAGDGYSAEIDLAAVQACTDCMLAFTDTPGQLSAVMPGQVSNLWVKDIVKIEVK